MSQPVTGTSWRFLYGFGIVAYRTGLNLESIFLAFGAPKDRRYCCPFFVASHSGCPAEINNPRAPIVKGSSGVSEARSVCHIEPP
jgi:hypothetical protein